jgi:hypothetical protein
MPISNIRLGRCASFDPMGGRPQIQFHEVQPLRQWHARILLAFPPAALLIIAVRQLVFHRPWGNPPLSNGSVIFLTVLLLAVYIRLITVRLVTDLRSGELSVGLRGLWRRKRVPLDTIRSATAVQYDPIGEYGGYGIRSGARGLAYIASGNRAVQLELKDGRRLLVGSQHAEELALKIMQSKNGAG